MEKKGAEYDVQIVMPYTTLEDIVNVKQYSSYIGIKLTEDADIDKATKEIELALLRDLKKDEFTLFSQKDLLNSVQEILEILTVGLGAVAGISIVVGGIGIMNIILVSVTERIKEIGLRKALGATSANIGIQFMFESVMISVIGGMLGVLLGGGATLIAQKWLRAEVPLWAVGLSFGFSSVVGIVFGTYPALRASRFDPIDALRYE